MKLTLLAGTANPPLAGAIAAALGTAVSPCTVTRFPDGEISVALGESVRDRRVCLLQPTAPPVDSSLLELLLLADACRRDGASSITAVVPYFGYARQDRRTGRSAIGGRAVAAMIESAGIDRVVAVDLHSASVEGFFDIPVEHLTAVPLLAERLRGSLIANSVIVAPDLGAAKLAERYASILGLPVAIVQKKRVSGTAVSVHGILGDVEGRAPVIVDDMISTGATIEAAANALLAAGAKPQIIVAATHALLVGNAVEWLRALPLRRLIVSDSVVVPPGLPLPIDIASLGPLLAESIAGPA